MLMSKNENVLQDMKLLSHKDYLFKMSYSFIH